MVGSITSSNTSIQMIGRQSVHSRTDSATQESLIPPTATAITIDGVFVIGEDGTQKEEFNGIYTITITYTDGHETKTKKVETNGMEMILLMGAFLTQKLDQTVFAPLVRDIESRNEVIEAVNKVMPIAVNANKNSGWLQEPEKTIWETYIKKIPKDMFNGYNYNALTDNNVTHTDAPQLIDVFQNTLTKYTQANEQTMLELNTKSSLRTTFFSMMQANMSVFKQSIEAVIR